MQPGRSQTPGQAELRGSLTARPFRGLLQSCSQGGGSLLRGWRRASLKRPEEPLAPACCILPLWFPLIICIYFEKCISCFVQITVIKHPHYRRRKGIIAKSQYTLLQGSASQRRASAFCVSSYCVFLSVLLPP